MSEKRIVQESLHRLLRNDGDGFFREFYERFSSISPQIAHKFELTDMPRQESLLRSSLYHMLDFYESGRPSYMLAEVARRHSRRELDILPALYEDWVSCLLGCIQDFDPACNTQVIAAWQHVMRPLIEYMQSHYETETESEV